MGEDEREEEIKGEDGERIKSWRRRGGEEKEKGVGKRGLAARKLRVRRRRRGAYEGAEEK